MSHPTSAHIEHEHRLREQVERLAGEVQRLREERSLLLEHSSDGFWDWDIPGDFEYMSPRFWEIFGYRPEEKKHHPSEWQALIHPSDLPGVMERFDQHVQSRGEVPYDQQVRYRHKDGHWVTVRCKGKVIEWDEHGAPTRMVGTHTDLTNLVETRSRAEILYSSSAVGIWDWLDVQGDKEYWTPRFYHLLGYEFEEIPPTLASFQELLHPEDRERTFAMVQSHFAREGPFDLEYRLRHKSGQYRWFHGMGEAVFDEEGEPTRMVGSIQDIHERKVAEEDRERHARDLERLNTELEQFVYFASHDLQAPLRHITSFIDMIEKHLGDDLDDKAAKWFGYVESSATKMTRLIEDLLAYSRAGQVELVPEDISLENVVQSVTTLINGEGIDKEGGDSEHGATALDVEHEALPTIQGTRSQIIQLFQNLLENALKYRRQEVSPKARIDAEETSSGWIIKVSDNGVGIPEKHYATVFEPFRRLSSESIAGSGIGLAISAKIVERHGGAIHVSSTEGEGSTFTFSIRKPPPQTPTTPPPPQ